MATAEGCPLPMNSDISGIGVRVSFYLQTLFLSCLSARSGSLEEITGALYTLLFTNTAMAVTALILGFKPVPEISLQDAIVVFYLLLLSWTTVTLTLPACSRFPLSLSSSPARSARSLTLLHTLSVLQSYTIFAFLLALTISAPTFGSPTTVQCNPQARAVLFRPFSALGAGRVLGAVATGVVVVVYTGVLVRDHLPPAPDAVRRWMRRTVLRRVPNVERKAAEKPGPQPGPAHANPPRSVPPGLETFGPGALPRGPRRVPGRNRYRGRTAASDTQRPSYDLQIAWPLVIHLFVVCVLWTLAVMNTELLIRWNTNTDANVDADGGSGWGFGQILPMFLVLLPLANVINAFREFGLRPLPMWLLVGPANANPEDGGLPEGKV
ncbi:hypothetical protein MIND_00301200 [Mycena indigotica]|uniref:Uncharacterized protein n=1 Tax=Mycena indigotica TaxID=2126181 RepID=A0A8H6WEC0_9AGAR|nr:uncharacterized protein MIND_00301200 [Mycena indigotica]KAF7309309.1 hypothetical protein MIND_00301200 [Mycena indigotica]